MTIKATTKAVVKYLEAIKQKHKEEILFACGYEAGPTGYGLCRGLQKAGYGCVVMASTTMSNPDGKKRMFKKAKQELLSSLLRKRNCQLLWIEV